MTRPGGASAVPSLVSAALPRVLPFFAYVLVIAVTEAATALGLVEISPRAAALLYPLKAGLTAVALAFCLPRCPELSARDFLAGRKTLFSLLIGLVIFILWINLDFSWARLGEPTPFMPEAAESPAGRLFLISLRFCGAAILVPLAEELFWRSFLIRFLERGNFTAVPIGRPRPFSFMAVAVLFALEHHQILAGLVAGIGYNLVLCRTKSIAQCVLSHAVTNAALAVWVLITGSWHFW